MRGSVEESVRERLTRPAFLGRAGAHVNASASAAIITLNRFQPHAAARRHRQNQITPQPTTHIARLVISKPNMYCACKIPATPQLYSPSTVRIRR